MIRTGHLHGIQITRGSHRQQESAEISPGGTKTVQAHTVMVSFQCDDEKDFLSQILENLHINLLLQNNCHSKAVKSVSLNTKMTN